MVLIAVAITVAALDQSTKALALANLEVGKPVDVVGELLRFNLLFNEGAAFGLAQGYTVLLTCLAAGVVTFVIILARKLASVPWAIALGLLLGGALGNLTDRIFRSPGPFRGWVVDFLQLPNWPVFNVADMSIVSAAVLIVLLSLTGRHLDGGRDPKQDKSGPAKSESEAMTSETKAASAKSEPAKDDVA